MPARMLAVLVLHGDALMRCNAAREQAELSTYGVTAFGLRHLCPHQHPASTPKKAEQEPSSVSPADRHLFIAGGGPEAVPGALRSGSKRHRCGHSCRGGPGDHPQDGGGHGRLHTGPQSGGPRDAGCHGGCRTPVRCCEPFIAPMHEKTPPSHNVKSWCTYILDMMSAAETYHGWCAAAGRA